MRSREDGAQEAAAAGSEVEGGGSEQAAGIKHVLEEAAAQAARNRRRAVGVLSPPGIVLLVAGTLVGLALSSLVLGAAAGALLGVVLVVAVRRGACTMVLGALRARPVGEEEVPRVSTQVEGLCATMGLAVPSLFLVDDEMPNAMMVGRGPKDTAMVLTSGLLDSLDPVALEGVLAHELTHVKRGDVVPATMALAVILSAGFFVPAGIAARWVHRVAGPGREMDTDREAVRVTRYPPGLSQALALMEGSPTSQGSVLSATRVAQASRWLWTAVLPDTAPRRPEDVELVGELDAPAVRVAALDEW